MNDSTLIAKQGLPVLFVARRAFRFGSVASKDLQQAFDISPASATRVSQAALHYYKGILTREGRRIVPCYGVAAPREAGDEDLMTRLTEGVRPSARDPYPFQVLGLRWKELYVASPSLTQARPERPGVLTALVKASAREQFVQMKYVGLRRGESARWRLVAPAGLEQVNGSWRLLAHDLEAADAPLKAYVLPRILEVGPPARAKVPGFARPRPDDRQIAVKARFNGALTEDQRKALAYELCAQTSETQPLEATISLASRSLFDFKSRFCAEPVRDSVVWPALWVEEA